MTRTTSPGGRWVYTLYAGGERPFIHALDTVGRTSLCLDPADWRSAAQGSRCSTATE